MSAPKILVTYIESGFGHITSAQSIAEQLKRKYGDKLDIVEAEIMREDNNENLIGFEKFLTQQTIATNKIWAYGDLVFSFINIGKNRFMRFIHHTLFRRALNGAVEAFRLRNPDVIVSTHYFITFAAIEYKRRCDPNVTVITYNPDNNVHVWWDNRSDIFITNNTRASNEAVHKLNFPYESIRQVYFTAREKVRTANLTKEEYRQKYNIPQDKFCVMVAEGGYARGKAQSFAREFCRIKKPLTVLFLAGENDKAYAKFEKLAKSGKLGDNVTLIPFRFTPDVHELYAASDLLCTKAGPNTIMDSLYVNTPVMVDHCPHPIERASYKLFVKTFGCGVGRFYKRPARKTLEKFIDDPSLLDEYRENINKNIDKNRNGAEQIADIVYGAVQEKLDLSEKIQ